MFISKWIHFSMDIAEFKLYWTKDIQNDPHTHIVYDIDITDHLNVKLFFKAMNKSVNVDYTYNKRQTINNTFL